RKSVRDVRVECRRRHHERERARLLRPVPLMAIESAAIGDPRLAWYRGVGDPSLLRDGNRFVAEGRTVVARLIEESRWPIESVLVSPAALAAMAPAFARRPDLPVFVVPVDDVVSLAGFNVHRGCLAVGLRVPLPDLADIVPVGRRAAWLLGLEGLANADN